MGGEYRLVSEEEYQNLLEAIDHEHRLREMEADAARRWQERAERAERKIGLDSSAWTYSDDPAGCNEWREDEADPEPCDGCAGCHCWETDEAKAKPQRPHDSLVWAILFAGYSASEGRGTAVLADEALKYWRERWPEDET